MEVKARTMLAITGGKGGCGKTTTALGLAGALAGQGYEPLVVDGDCDMPDVHHRLGLERAPGVDGFADGKSLTDCLVRPDQQSRIAVLTGGRREALNDALRTLTCWKGPVIVDCSAGTNRESLLPLRHADRAIVVSTDQPQCLEDAAITRTVARRLSAAVAGVLLRKTGSSGRESTRQLSGGARIPSSWRVLGVLPPVNEPLNDERTVSTFRSTSTALYPPVTDRVKSSRTKRQTARPADGYRTRCIRDDTK